MNIALFNERIVIEKNTQTVDGIGNHINAWVDYMSCWATVSGESGADTETAAVQVDTTKAAFTIRWSAAASLIDNLHYRVKHNGELYNIKTVDHMSYKHKGLKLTCEKVRRG